MNKKKPYIVPASDSCELHPGNLMETSVPITEETTEDDARMSRRHEIWK